MPITKFEGVLKLLHEVDVVDNDAVMAGIYSECSTREIVAYIQRFSKPGKISYLNLTPVP